MGGRPLHSSRAFDPLGVDPLNRFGPPRKLRSRGGVTRGRRPSVGNKPAPRRTPPAAPLPAPSPAPAPPAAAPEEAPYWKSIYVQHAYSVSYVMQAKSAGESAWEWGRELLDSLDGEIEDKPARVQSFLGGAFLRMYLDHEVDQEIIDQAGKEIAVSKEWKALTAGVAAYVQQIANRTPKPLDAEAVKQHANKHLATKLKKGGVQFRDTLNPVIGGAGGIEVTGVKHVRDGARVGKKLESTYELQVKVSDVYDFQNKRTGEYQRYRENLALLLRSDQYSQFNLAYFGEVQPIRAYKSTNLDYAGTFASFMYALERKGWTPGGLAWEVSVPMTVEFKDAQPR